MREPRVCVVILNWNQSAVTRRCVAAVLGQTPAPAVLVVDNGSDERDAADLASLPAGVTVRRTGANLGFAGGMNVGIAYAIGRGYEYVWLLNNDCFPDPGCLGELVSALDADARLAVVLPALRGGDGGRHIVGATVDWRSGSQESAFAMPTGLAAASEFALIGCALFVRGSVLAAVGGFDARFFAYREDDDWCVRVARRGGRFAVVPRATACHLGGVTSGGPKSPTVAYLSTRNGWLLLRKHLRGLSQPTVLARYAADKVAEAGKFYHAGHDAVAAGTLSGLVAGLRGHCGPPNVTAPPRWLVGLARRCPWRFRQAVWRLASLLPIPVRTRRR